MDVKETLTRWSRAYMEPSLFYVPAKKSSDDEYYNITFHMMVDYFDTVDEKILTNMTIKQMFEKYEENVTTDKNNIKYGSIGQNYNTESIFFVAYDENGNIADCSLWRDFFSIAEATSTEEKNGYTLDTYSVTKIPELYRTLFIAKNIADVNTLNAVFEDMSHELYYCLYILASGDIYRFMPDYYDNEAKKWVYKSIKVGEYNYATDKFKIEDEDTYYTFGLNNASYNWLTPNKVPNNFNYYHAPYKDYYNNSTVPTLRLKKGTYTIKQIVASTGCEIMKPITVAVNGDRTIYYKTTLNGAIMRSECIDCQDSYHELYATQNTGWDDKWFLDESSTQGGWEIINYTYRLSDNALLVRQKCCNSTSNNINGIPGEYMASTGEKFLITIYYGGKIKKFYTTAGVYNEKHPDYPLDYPDNTIISSMYSTPFYYKRPLTAEEINKMGIKAYDGNRGTNVGSGSTYFYDLKYMYFDYTTQYSEGHSYDDHCNEYDILTNEPTAGEIAAAINKKEPLEWYETYIKEGEAKEFIKDGGHLKYYVTYKGGIAYYMYDYHGLNFQQKLLNNVTSPFWDESVINTVLDYYKSEDADIENMSKYLNMSVYCYDLIYSDETKTSITQYKNYHTMLSSEVKQDPDWNEEKFNKFQTEMRHKLYEEQLK